MRSMLATLTLGAALALVSTVSTAADAPDPVIGTWKLNAAKSSGPLVAKSDTRTYSASADGVTMVWKRAGADGKESTVQGTFKYDGKDYPISGSPDFDALSLKRLDANTTESVQKRMGKAVGHTKRTVSSDGKTLTLTSQITNAKGEKIESTLVYDRM